MPAPVKTAILIPVYDHGASLRHVVLAALRQHPHVIVVDDGCTDGGPESLAGLPAHLVRHERNRGKGAAIRSGAAAAVALGYTHVITLDADGQHKAEDIPAFLAAIEESPWSIIIGARDFNVPNVPGSSRFGRKFSQFWMFVQTGLNISDMQSGFRAYPVGILERVVCSDSGYSFEIEIVVRAAWAGFAIREIPVQVFYPPREERRSHFKALADNLRITWLNTRLTIRAFLPLPFSHKSLAAEGRISLRHPLRTLRVLLDNGGTPRELGRAAAWSIFLSTLPLPGLQTLLLLFFIQWKRLNRLCALVMVPLTWPPFVPGLAVLLGYRILRERWLTEFSIQTLGHEVGDRFLDWIVGSLALAPFLGAACGVAVFLMAKACGRLLQAPSPQQGGLPRVDE